MSLSSAETSSCSRRGAWASRLRCLWTVQRWVGTSPQSAANACSSPVPPSTIRISGLRSPRLTRSSRTARQASLVSPPMFLMANSIFWPSSRTPSTTKSTIEVALRSSRTRTTVPSRIRRTVKEPLTGLLEAVGDRPAFEPPFADEGSAARLDHSRRGGVDHVVVVGRDLVVQPLGRVGQQVAVFLDGHQLPAAGFPPADGGWRAR